MAAEKRMGYDDSLAQFLLALPSPRPREPGNEVQHLGKQRGFGSPLWSVRGKSRTIESLGYGPGHWKGLRDLVKDCLGSMGPPNQIPLVIREN